MTFIEEIYQEWLVLGISENAKEMGIASEEDHQELLVMSRSLKIEKRYSQRAEVILLSLEGKVLMKS